MTIPVVLLLVMLQATMVVTAAEEPSPARPGPAEQIQLKFPDNTELKVLIDYVSQRLDVNFLYDEQVASKRITIKSPEPVTPDALMGLLESALRMKDLLLVDAEQPGWKRIVPLRQMSSVARAVAEEGETPAQRDLEAITRIFHLQHADVRQVEQLIKPFVSTPGGNSLPVERERLLIVTDFAANIERIAGFIELADVAPGEVSLQFLPVQHLDASHLSQRVVQIHTAKAKARGVDPAGSTLDVSFDERTNQLLLIGSPDEVAEAQSIAASLDVPLGLETRVYELKVLAPDRLDKLARDLLGPNEAKRHYRSSVDTETGLLIATTTPTVHEQLEAMRGRLDVPLPEEQSPIRFYKLANADASSVLATIRSIESGTNLEAVHLGGDAAASDKQPAAGSNLPAPGATPPFTPGAPRSDAYLPDPQRGLRERRGGNGLDAVRGRQATVTADKNTNTIIVVAQPAVQAVYEQLIKMLDRRRPQVLLETTIVTLDTSDGFSLGVEISRAGSFGREGKTLSFSSFGLSEVDPDTGRLSLVPGLGFNGAVISADIADVVVRALKTDGRAKVVSAPKVLVNDNATGTISSVSEAPFTSVNASTNVATTSFGGFVSAGTEIAVTPQIAEGDHLRLEFSISLNSFSGEGSEGIPPPRQTNVVQSEVTVPDGHTIIVGGINRRDLQETVSRVPILGQIPVLEYLFSSRDKSVADSTLFVFIRPVILRDNAFEDLKYFSSRDAERADLPSDFPQSEPLLLY